MRASPRAQGGAALIILMTVIVIGVAWFTVGLLGNAARTKAEKEQKTGAALAAGKQALLAYIAQYAARSNTADPGQVPCPESLTLSSPGQSSPTCSGSALVVGRLPWKTLGIDELYDGDGEPLWYVMRGFRNPPINFGTAGQLSLNGTTMVALIIAPGAPLNTGSLSGAAPSGCTKQDQMVATRNTATLNAANFVECGLASGSVTTPGDSTWTNDRLIGISEKEWADAVAPGVADRLQRQVAPAIEDWRASQSVSTWGSSFVPFASSFGDPTANDLCGDSGVLEGLPPFAPRSLTGCPRFTASSSLVLGLLSSGCTQSATSADCSFLQFFGTAPFSARITATALAGGAFRGRISAADIVVSNGGTVTNFSLSYDAATGRATAIIDVTWPVTLGLLSAPTVSVPHLPDAPWLSDSRVAWFIDNEWPRYTYYGASSSVTPGGSGTCTSTTCLTVSGLPASNGYSDDKKFVLVLTGRRLAGATWPSSAMGNYFEAANASSGDRTYQTGTMSAAFNDRVAACPFKYVDTTGTDRSVCN